jgi:hypothetical protein
MSYCAKPPTQLQYAATEAKMILSLAATFVVGVAFGMFLGVIGLSLCLIGKRMDAMVEASAEG